MTRDFVTFLVLAAAIYDYIIANYYKEELTISQFIHNNFTKSPYLAFTVGFLFCHWFGRVEQ